MKDPKKILVIALGVLGLVLLPLKIAKGKGDDTKKQTSAVQAQIADKDQQLKTARKAVSAKQANQTALDVLGVRMPAKSDEEGFISQLEQLASQSGVEWLSSSFTSDDSSPGAAAAATTTTTTLAGAKPVGGASAAPAGKPASGAYADRVSNSFVVAIEIVGPFGAQMTYLEKLRSMDRLFTIDKVDFALAAPAVATGVATTVAGAPTTTAPADAAKAPIHASIQLRAYTWTGPSTPASTTTTTAATTASAAATTAASITAAPITAAPTTVKA